MDRLHLDRIKNRLRKFGALNAGQKAQYLRREWNKRVGRAAVPGGLAPTQVERRINAVRNASRRAWQRYQPRAYAGRLMLFSAEEGAGRLHAAWQPLAQGGLDVVTTPGSHLNMFEEPHVGALARRIAATLARLGGDGGPPPIVAD